jgi:predicted N-acetyltransferase YhbS
VDGWEARSEDREISGTIISVHGVEVSVLAIRALTLSDLQEVMEVQRSAYLDALVEPEASFACKLRLPGSVALGAFEGGRMSAYLLCHPWSLGKTAPLNACDLVLPRSPSCMYFHDLAVRPERRGQGLADRLVSEALSIAEARGLHACALVAVQSSRPFWERHGFRSQAELEYVAEVRAHYMVRR